MGQTASRARLQIGSLLGLAFLISIVRSHWAITVTVLAIAAADHFDATLFRKTTTPAPVVVYIFGMAFVAAIAWYF